MFSMKCPQCGAESKLSFINNTYEGPRRCWSCHGLFKIKILNSVLIYCEPLSDEEFKKLQEIDALKSKLKNQSSD